MLRLKEILDGRGISLGQAALKIPMSKGLLSGIVNQEIPISSRSHCKIRAYLESIGVDGEAASWHLPQDKGVRMLQQDVLRHWGFGRDPFINEIMDPAEDCYLTEEARWVERSLSDLIDGKGFAALVGPTGAGKSTLIDRICATKRNLAVAKPRLCDTEALHAGAIYDAVIYDFTDETPRQSREARARQMLRALAAKQAANEHALLIVEEAHRLHITTLRALKSFYDEKLRGRRLLSILLVGQEGLRDKINRADMLEVSRRCQVFDLRGFVRCKGGKDLPPTAATIRAYLDAKFNSVGVASVFREEAIEALATRADVPLALNCLASAAMTLAWEKGDKTVTKEHVNAC